MKNILIIILVIAVIGGGIFLYSKKKSAEKQPATSTNTTTTQMSPVISQAMKQAASPSGVMTATQKITVEGGEFSFTPSTLTLKKGEPVELTFKNTGKYTHNLTISELNVKTKTIAAGEQDTVQFTPTQTGKFTYFCSVDSHEQKGMKGTLTVQ